LTLGEKVFRLNAHLAIMAAAERDETSAETYLNPVHARDFPDPFVLKFAGEYFAYCTGLQADARAFGVMRSRDLVRWSERAGALEPLPGEHPCYWAPEVYYRDGKFLMYYSVGNETLMHVRVAVAEHPTGLFVDSGRRLTKEEFAIDPHVFTDADGARYLFYATDFLEHTHIGTGTVVDRMLDDFTLQGRPRPVTRALYDWQVYDPARKEKGGVRWHTVEGPFVLAHRGRYYEMFSGGNWQNISYGVSYATSDRVLSDKEWEQHADGVKVLPVLRTIPGEVVGPGHNSVVRAPDNQQLFCVYHRWAEEGRVLSIDRLEFVGDALTVAGATTTPQPAPNAPWFADYFDEPRAEGLGKGWEYVGGCWSVRGGEARQEAQEGVAEAVYDAKARSFIAELSLRALAADAEKGAAFGVSLYDGDAPALRFTIDVSAHRAVLWGHEGGKWSKREEFKLPGGFRPDVYHQLRLEVDHMFVCVTLDEGAIRWRGQFEFERNSSFNFKLCLFTENTPAAFRGFTLTLGWEDDFADPDIYARGWAVMPVRTEEAIQSPIVRRRCGGRFTDERLSKRLPLEGLEAYELVVNLKIDPATASTLAPPSYEIFPGVEHPSDGDLTLKLIDRSKEQRGLALIWRGKKDDTNARMLRVPESFNPFEFHQLRLRRTVGRLTVQLGAEVLGEVAASPTGGSIGLTARGACVVLDMVRLTAIKTSSRINLGLTDFSANPLPSADSK
jgi:GH43 family beta-xylosidase